MCLSPAGHRFPFIFLPMFRGIGIKQILNTDPVIGKWKTSLETLNVKLSKLKFGLYIKLVIRQERSGLKIGFD